jgi:cellulose synthase/poly-beta-1,6-N-acetylglucosamine synthase-like glycosyltransferase
MVLFGFVFLAYTVFSLLLLWGWMKVVALPPVQPSNEEMISVLVPARNEASKIARLLDDLKNQDDSSFEVIVVDDHSEDDTYNIVRKTISQGGFDQLMIISLKDGHGEKKALARGVSVAKGSIIVTTDADCRIGRRWLSGFRKYFSDSTVKLAFGAVRIKQDGTLWTSMQAIELASLIGAGAATNALGYPSMCNGANLAFSKEAFTKVGGYEGNDHIPSGDDEFLLRKIKRRFPGSIRFVADHENIVETDRVAFSAFVHQRIRWAGKWMVNDDVAVKMLAASVFLFHLIWLSSAVWLFFESNFILLLPTFTIKSFFELFFLRKVMRFLDSSWSWSAFVCLQFTYSFYVVFTGILANLTSPVWKGRKIRRAEMKINPVLRQNH